MRRKPPGLVFLTVVAAKPGQDQTDLVRARANLVKLRQLDVTSLNLCSVDVEPVDYVRDLGVFLDRELSKRVHISKISSTSFSSIDL